MSLRHAVEEVVYRASLRLDARDFSGFLELCDDDFLYTVGAYSPEIRRQMIWLEHDKAGLETLFDTLSRHNSDHAPLARHVTVYTIEFSADLSEAAVTSALQVFLTSLDGGASALFAVGKIHDVVRVGRGTPLLARRRIDLDTRQLGIGSHIPF